MDLGVPASAADTLHLFGHFELSVRLSMHILITMELSLK